MIFWACAFLLMQLSRLFFLLRSSATFEGAPFLDLSKAFLNGFRFDLSVIGYFLLVMLAFELLLFFLPLKSKCFWLRLLKSVGFTLIFVLALIDVEYFVLTHKHLDASIISISGDIRDQSLQLVSHYYYIALSSLLVFLILWHFSGRHKPQKGSLLLSPIRKITLFVLSIPLGIFLARGGLQEKPLKISSALALQDSRLIDLTLNAPFIFFQTLRSESKLAVFRDYEKLPAALILATERPQQGGAELPQKSQSILLQNPADNVVIVILESFGSEYSYATPFMNKLKKQGLSFENHFANGRTSIEAIPAILAALPSLLAEPYISSRYVGSKLKGLPVADTAQQHDFLFMHGARKGSMYFDSFTSFLGFSKYYGKEDYTGDPSALYDWGVHDHAFFDFAGKTLNSLSRSFVASIFSLSSHQPFEIPKSFESRIEAGPNPFVRSLRYADKSLELFFEKYKAEPWFKKTLFILTADHTSQCHNLAFCSQVGSHRVPLVLFHGSKNLGGLQFSKVTQHADIPFAVADYLDLDASRFLPFGHSFLDSRDKGVALLRDKEEFQLLTPRGFFRLKGAAPSLEFRRCEVGEVAEKNCSPVNPQEYLAEEKYLKAARSYLTQSLDERSFY